MLRGNQTAERGGVRGKGGLAFKPNTLEKKNEMFY